MRKLTVEGDAPICLKAWLHANFPAMPKRAVAALLRARDVRVNGRRTGEDVALSPGDEVVLYAADAALDGPPLDVVWLSGALLVAVKPPGVSSAAAGEADMEELAARWLRQRGEAPFVKACHRLDNQTGGLMMLARSEAAALAVRELMEAGKIVKTYHCIVKGVPEPAHATLTAWMKKDEARATVAVFDRPAPGARTAVTQYALVRTDGERSLMEITLHTGRTHQIRAHMAHIGHPLLGDDKYGDRAFNKAHRARRQKLWASRLAFAFEASDCPELREPAGKTLESAAPFMDEVQSKKISSE
jgi:23S rRNA pseudouridine955/2504/2580 synthase